MQKHALPGGGPAPAIVHHHAGATSTGLGKSMTGNFDHGGNTVLATARTESVDHANRDDSLEIPEGSSQDRANGDKAYRFGNVPWSTVLTMEPGDWLYIDNANKSISGAHSVIFGAGSATRAPTRALLPGRRGRGGARGLAPAAHRAQGLAPGRGP